MDNPLIVTKKQLIFQVSLAILYLVFLLVSLDYVVSARTLWAVGASSLASSAYLVFSCPKNSVSAPSRIFFGYIIAVICGELVRWAVVGSVCWIHQLNVLTPLCESAHLYWLSAAFAVGLSIVVMVLLDCQHPPAAGFSLALVIELDHYIAILVIVFFALLLSGIAFFLEKNLKNLS